MDLNSILCNFVVFGLATALATAEPVPDVHAIAHAVDERYNHLRSLQAEFTEVYRGAGMERTESGTLLTVICPDHLWPKNFIFLNSGMPLFGGRPTRSPEKQIGLSDRD